MLKEKAQRLSRRLRRNLRPLLLLWFPAGIVALLLGIVFFSVGFSKDASFYSCSKHLRSCIEEKSGFSQVVNCSYQTAWCDVKIVWEKVNGRPIPLDLPDLPHVDEKAEKELFEKLTSDEFLEKRFEEFSQEEQAKQSQKELLTEKEDLKEYMEKAREERIRFERDMAEKMKAVVSEQSENIPEKNNLSGQNEK